MSFKTLLTRRAPLWLAAAGFVVLGAGPARAAHVEPVFVSGNQSCAELAPGTTELKVEPVVDGTYSDGVLSVTVDVRDTADGQVFDWTSNIGLDAVFAKGGDNGNLYSYDPEATSDTGLHAPDNSSGNFAGLSHISFCYDIELGVTKTAQTAFTRTFSWDIVKSVSPSIWDLFEGDTGTSLYTVSITKTGFTDSGWAVFGTISINNPAASPATITGVTDALTGGISAPVECGVTFPYALAGGATLVCTYATALPDGSNRTNTATVTTSGSIGGGSGTANAIFGAPTTLVNDTINVDDTFAGALGSFSDTGSTSYTRTFACGADEGQHDNTATIVETGQSSSASVDVNCYDLTVTKDAFPAFARRWSWTIDKSSPDTNLLLAPGQTYLIPYSVVVAAFATDSEFAVTGNITILNNHPSAAATLTTVADIVSPAIAATVNCPALTVPAGGVLVCTYSADLPDATTQTNTATATQQNHAYDESLVATPSGTSDYSGSAAVDFASASFTELDECVNVVDTVVGLLGTVCAGDAPQTFNYVFSIGPFSDPEDCFIHSFPNVATAIANDTGTTVYDDWNVDVEIACVIAPPGDGCTLTPGYWKTHSEFGPAPYDDLWAQLPDGASTPFFLSGQSYYDVLWTSPNGNAYYVLAHAYIAAALNQLNGASIPAEVLTAFDQATVLFQTYTPAQIGALKGHNALRATFISLATTLDDYNNGVTGPGHCSE